MEVTVAVVQTPVTWDISQNLATITAPRGEILGDLPASPAGILRTVIDTGDVSDWYLSQRRTDVLRPIRA